MNETHQWQIKNPEYLMIEDAFGGNQAWFRGGLAAKYLRLTGCGLICLTNLLLYHWRALDLHLDSILGPKKDFVTREEYIFMATQLARVLKPTPFGVFSRTHMNYAVKSVTRRTGRVLLPMKNDWRWNKTNALTYLIAGLSYNSPIALMSYQSRVEDLRYHWVLVTGLRIDGEKAVFRCSNWGREREYSFDDWFDSPSLYKAMIYYL